MNQYIIQPSRPHRHYLDIRMLLDTRGAAAIRLQLPAWRPGRYELANYAKNIQYWNAFDGMGRPLPFQKISKDCWDVNTAGAQKLEIRYNYYANQLDAGASFYDDRQIYINPVNCLLYPIGRLDEPCSISLIIPSQYRIASALNFNAAGTALCSNYHELVDSPLIASASLQQREYRAGTYRFSVSFQGSCRPDWERLLGDFSIFSNAHIKLFGSLPVKEYHFLFQVSPSEAYHGVEHAKSCVIHFGPGEQLMEEAVYKTFLGICSHELFHCWNIKAIRPREFLSYDYSKELYSHLGYVAEGVTTYFGDLQLLRCGLYNWGDYSLRLEQHLVTYFHSEGRKYQSLAASSFESWLDGYKDEAPDRKVSMYVKGALFTLLKDTALRASRKDGKTFDWVMQWLYHEYALKGRGYTVADMERLLVEHSDTCYHDFFTDYFRGLAPMEKPLEAALKWLGCRMEKIPSPKIHERYYGIKLNPSGTKTVIQVAADSPADIGGISIEDEIIAINGQLISEQTDVLFRFAPDKDLALSIRRRERLLEIVLQRDGREYFPRYQVEKMAGSGPEQQKQFQLWSGQGF